MKKRFSEEQIIGFLAKKVVTAPVRRLLVRSMVEKGLSERRALVVARMSASALRYEPRPDHNVELREQIAALAHRHRRYGVGKIHLKLRQSGFVVNYKRVERLYEEAGLQVRRRKRKKVPVGERQPLLRPSAANQVLPQVIRTDNGKEFCGKAMVAWAHEKGIALRLIEPGKPNQNAYVESFNGRLRALRIGINRSVRHIWLWHLASR